jgi:hypothetical protein
MGGWCKERYNKDENNKLEGLHQKPDQMEEIRWEGCLFSEVVEPQEEEEEGFSSWQYTFDSQLLMDSVGYLVVTVGMIARS